MIRPRLPNDSGFLPFLFRQIYRQSSPEEHSNPLAFFFHNRYSELAYYINVLLSPRFIEFNSRGRDVRSRSTAIIFGTHPQ